MKRRSTFVPRSRDRQTALSIHELVLIFGTIVLTLLIMLMIAVSAAKHPTPQPGVLGPERGDRAYCWYVSDPCSAPAVNK